MVEDLSHFNAIMGCAWLHRMKVFPSTYHQMVSYLIENGQINLLGNQLVMRQCYQVALDSEHPASEEAHPKLSNTREH